MTDTATLLSAHTEHPSVTATSITLARLDGTAGELATIQIVGAHVWQRANDVLRVWVQTAPTDLKTHKVNVAVKFDDETVHGYRVELNLLGCARPGSLDPEGNAVPRALGLARTRDRRRPQVSQDLPDWMVEISHD